MKLSDQIDPEIECHPALLYQADRPYTGRQVVHNIEGEISYYNYWVKGCCVTKEMYEAQLRIRKALHHPSGVTLTF